MLSCMPFRSCTSPWSCCSGRRGCCSRLCSPAAAGRVRICCCGSASFWKARLLWILLPFARMLGALLHVPAAAELQLRGEASSCCSRQTSGPGLVGLLRLGRSQQRAPSPLGGAWRTSCACQRKSSAHSAASCQGRAARWCCPLASAQHAPHATGHAPPDCKQHFSR